MDFMSVNDVIKKLQTVPAKQRELPMIIKAGEATEGVAEMHVGVRTDTDISFPQLGQEPNCIVMRITDSTEG